MHHLVQHYVLVLLLFALIFIPYLHAGVQLTSTYVEHETSNEEWTPDQLMAYGDGPNNIDGPESDGIQTLYVAALFPMSGTGGWIGGHGCLPAARMALDDVNARSDLLPGYRLSLRYADSSCNPGKAAKFMYDMIYYPPKKIILVCGCSTVCSIVAESANMWNLIVVGYGASSPALSDRGRFPTFFRTHPSATIHNPTRIKLFQKYGWSRVAIILETEEVFIETARDLEERCREQNIQLLTRVSFVSQPSDALDNLKRADPRIIVGMFYKHAARRVMCEAYKRGLYGDRYVWFLIGWYEDDWWTDVSDLSCTLDQMRAVVQGHLTTEALVLNQDNTPTFSGMTSQQWLERYNAELLRASSYSSATQSQSNVSSISLSSAINMTNIKSTFGKQSTQSRPEGYQEAPLAYDAIWAIALALNKTIKELERHNLRIENFNYSGTPHVKNIFLSNLRTTNFLGISGEVAFSDIGDRIAWTQIEQMIDGNYSVIGYYDTRTNNLSLYESRIHWPRGEPPRDRTIIMEVVQHISLPLMISFSVISIIGILGSIGLMYFNWTRRTDNLIRMSHPLTNNLMLLGSIVCLFSVILFGLDGRFVPQQYFYLLCDSRAWCLCIGFSLFFGSMFSKVWQSYVLSIRDTKMRATNRHVILMVGSFCLADVIILSVWKIYEPMDRMIEKIKEHSGVEINMDEDVIVELKIEYCRANLFWYNIIYCYKGLLLLLGLFLSYETRTVKLRQLNDSKLVGMCIYNVAILCVITGPVSLVNLMRQQINSHYAFIGATIIFCCCLSMTLIFIPKLIEYVRRQRDRSANQSGHNIVSDPRSSRDDEEQCSRLSNENRELGDKIREKELQIKAMVKRIDEIQSMMQSTSSNQVTHSNSDNKVTVTALMNEQQPLRDRRINKRVVRISEPLGGEESLSSKSICGKNVSGNTGDVISSHCVVDPVSDSGLGTTSKKCSDLDLSYL